mgnify:CR=1 FL=1
MLCAICRRDQVCSLAYVFVLLRLVCLFNVAVLLYLETVLLCICLLTVNSELGNILSNLVNRSDLKI